MLLFETHIFFLTVNLKYNITPSCSLCLQDGGKQKLEKAKITLNDCLACSGCITSAESVLITQQSHEEIYRVLRNNKVVCVCVCVVIHLKTHKQDPPVILNPACLVMMMVSVSVSPVCN